MATDGAVEVSFDVGVRRWGLLASSTSCKAAVTSAAVTGKPMPESELDSIHLVRLGNKGKKGEMLKGM